MGRFRGHWETIAEAVGVRRVVIGSAIAAVLRPLQLIRTNAKQSKLTVTVDRYTLPKERLAKLPPDQLQLLLLLGHVENEIVVICHLMKMCLQGRPTMEVVRKLILPSQQRSPAVQMMDHARAGQTLILMRILIGKLHDAWELFTKRFLSSAAMRYHLEHLDKEAQAALENLKIHFGQNSPLTRIRNSFSFHYSDKDNLIEPGFKRLPSDEPCYFYFGETRGNSFDYTSERVVTSSILEQVKELGTDDYVRLEKLFHTTLDVADQIQTVFDEVGGSILGRTGSPPKPTPIKLIGVQGLRSVQIPYFSSYWDDARDLEAT